MRNCQRVGQCISFFVQAGPRLRWAQMPTMCVPGRSPGVAARRRKSSHARRIALRAATHWPFTFCCAHQKHERRLLLRWRHGGVNREESIARQKEPNIAASLVSGSCAPVEGAGVSSKTGLMIRAPARAWLCGSEMPAASGNISSARLS